MATFTASTFFNQPRLNKGVQVAFFNYSSGATVFGSAGDVVLLAKIPNASQIIDAQFRAVPGSFSSGASLLGVLYATPASSPSTTIGAGSIRALSISAASGHAGTGTGFAFPRVSLSDDDAIQYAVVKFQITSTAATVTASFSLVGCVYYISDNAS